MQDLDTILARLRNFEPIQYVQGTARFPGTLLLCGPRVLIPRPETEELVANILAGYDEHFGGQPAEAVDIGTGSGAIAIALAKEEPSIHVTASDISEAAIRVARQNALDLGANVDF